MDVSRSSAAARGPARSSPVRLGGLEWLSALKRTGAQFMADDCMGLAQQMAYASLLAFFPAVAALAALLGLLHAYDDLQSFLAPVAPEAVMSLLQTFASDTGRTGSALALALGLAGAVWAASGAMGTVVKAVNRAYDREETRPFWRVRLLAIMLVIATGVVTMGTILLIVFGGTLGDAIARSLGLGSVFQWTWNIVRWPVAFAAVLTLLALVYSLGPNASARSWKWITPGSLLGGLAWLALSGLFALYTSFADTYTKTYGTLATAIILLLWLNFSAWAILFGAELNAELERRAGVAPPRTRRVNC